MSHDLPGIPEIHYDDLVAEARAKIPALAPEWTDHGPADTGVALIELLAWVTEVLGYRATRQTEAMTRAFLELLGGVAAGSTEDVHAALRSTLEVLWTRYRAATVEDYEHLALHEYPSSPEGQSAGSYPGGYNALQTAVCLADRNVAATNKLAVAPGHVSLVILRQRDTSVPKNLIDALKAFFEPRRLLTTRLHVSAPVKVYVPVEVDVYLDEGAIPATMHQRIWDAMGVYYDHVRGGPDGGGMPIGGEVFVSDLYRRVDALDGVDFVSRVELVVDDNNRRIKNERGDTVGLTIYPHEIAVYGTGRVKIRLFEPLSGGGWKDVSQ